MGVVPHPSHRQKTFALGASSVQAEALVGDARTYMLVLTANAQTDDREAVLSAGLDGLLIKPLDRERLREALSTASLRAFDPLAA